eukprot:TRINITY_DN24628_c0_g1_i4.p1 TRINITY_DN24628_c0_g1~~TRINITY_DN24628_c0_g1_i4.p1  ORF type:complete len:273 (-),score=19.15 TRINITY_DN24628_c0_g1_i4:268-1086(-)
MVKQEENQQTQNWSLPIYVCDFIISTLWIFTTCTFSELSEWIGQPTGISQLLGALLISSIAIMCFMPISSGLGGAMFNPVHHAAFFVVGKESFRRAIVRAVSQVGGGILGSHAAKAFMPPEFQQNFVNLQGGLKGEMGLELSFQIELIFGVVLNILILMATEVESSSLAMGLPLLANILLGSLGSQLTGPHLNPAETFAWYYHFASHDIQQHLVVHWLAPFCGAIIAGCAYRFLLKRFIIPTISDTPKESGSEKENGGEEKSGETQESKKEN